MEEREMVEEENRQGRRRKRRREKEEENRRGRRKKRKKEKERIGNNFLKKEFQIFCCIKLQTFQVLFALLIYSFYL